jgi:hypothetical protein
MHLHWKYTMTASDALTDMATVLPFNPTASNPSFPALAQLLSNLRPPPIDNPLSLPKEVALGAVSLLILKLVTEFGTFEGNESENADDVREPDAK